MKRFFAISKRGAEPGADHFGFQVDNAEDLAALMVRAHAADMALLDEGESTCCCAAVTGGAARQGCR